MQDYEGYNYEQDNINEEELLLSYIENIYPVTVVAYLLECTKFVEQWEWNQNKYREIKEKRLKEGESWKALTEEEIRYYGFTDEDIEEVNSYADNNSNDYKLLEEEYEKQKEFCRLIIESTDVQSELLRMVKTLEYNSESEKTIVTFIYTLAGMIKLGNILGEDRNEQNQLSNDKWVEIKEEISEKITELTAKEFLCLIELARANIVLTTEEYQDVIVEKISEMTELEFIRYLLDTDICEKSDNIKEIEKQKLEKVDSAFAQFYVYNDVDANTILRLLEETRSFDKVEVLTSIGDFEDERVAQKAYEMVKNLTAEQIVKYFITSKSDKTDSKICEILIERLKDLSDEDIKTLACFYRYEADEEFQNEVLKSAKKRGICKELDDIEENDDISKRITAIQESAGAINELPISILGVCWEYIGEIEKEEVEQNYWILDDYQKHKETQEKNENLWQYISSLSNMSIKKFAKIIIKVNQQIKVLNEKIEKKAETLSENAKDDDEIETYNYLEDFETKEEVAERERRF